MSRIVIARNTDDSRVPLARDFREFETVVGVDYYGVILPPEVEAYMLRLWAQINALENDLRTFFGKKYGVSAAGTNTAPPTYSTPASKWSPGDLQFAMDFDIWVNQYRQFARDYIDGKCRPDMNAVVFAACRDLHVAWQWAGSNSLNAYKQTEAYEKQYTDWQAKAKAIGVTVIAPDAKSAVTKLDLGKGLEGVGDILKLVVIGGIVYVGYQVFKTVAPSRSSSMSDEKLVEKTDAHTKTTAAIL